MLVRSLLPNSTSVISATARLPQRRNNPLLALAQINSQPVRVPNTTGTSSE